jgi:hypothetical protein
MRPAVLSKEPWPNKSTCTGRKSVTFTEGHQQAVLLWLALSPDIKA